MKWINEHDIRQWAEKEKRHCEENMPILLRKLIMGSVEHKYIKEINMSGGDSIAYSGFDGSVELEEGNHFVPKGKLLFEIGTDKDVKSKAIKDFNKRSSELSDSQKNDTTFVFVTPRLFSTSEAVKNELLVKSKWKGIVFIDALILENWIEACPAVGEWMARELLLKYPDTVIGLKTYWDTKFPLLKGVKLTTDIVLIGRTQSCNELILRAREPECTLVLSNSDKESLYFIVGTLLASENAKTYISKTLVIGSPKDFNSIVNSDFKLILVMTFYDRELIDSALQQGHTVFVACDRNINSNVYITIEINDMDEQDFDKALESSGFTTEKVRLLSSESLRDISTLRFILEYEKFIPEWQNTNDLKDCMAIIFTNSWDESYEIDRWVLEMLSEKNYLNDLDLIVKGLSGSNEKLLRNEDKKYYVAAPQLSFFSIKGKIPSSFFKNYREIVINVLTDVNPFVNMDSSERFTAQLRGLNQNCSNNLRRGLCHTLITISKSDLRIEATPSANWVYEIVCEILQNKNSENWKTLHPVLDLIVECSPEGFLDSLEIQLKEDDNVIKGLFNSDGDYFMFSQHYYTNLLRALEKLAWNEKYFERSVECLVRLSVIDPGGSLANRPINSLKEIYSPWFSQTYTNAQNRNKVLHRLRNIYPEQVFEVALSIMDYSSTIFPTETPIYENHEVKVNSDSSLEMYHAQLGAIDIISDLNAVTEKQLSSLLYATYRVFPDVREKIYKIIRQYSNNTMYDFWESLGKYISIQKQETVKREKLPTVEFDILWEVYQKISPEDDFEKTQRWFNSSHPHIIDEAENFDSDSRYDGNINHSIRVKVLQQLIDDHGLEKVIEKGKSYKVSNYFGSAIADIIETDKDIDLFLHQNLGSKLNVQCIQGFVLRKVYNHSSEWAFAIYTQLNNVVEIQDAAVTLTALNNQTEVIDFISNESTEQQRIFWQYVNPIFPKLTIDQIHKAIYGFKDCDRILELFSFATRHEKDIESEVLITLLTELGTRKLNIKDGKQVDAYNVFSIIEELHTRKDYALQDMINIEILFYNDLKHEHRFGKLPQSIHYALSNNAGFVNEILQLVFESEAVNIEENANKKLLNIETFQIYWHIWNTWDSIIDDRYKTVESLEQYSDYFRKCRELAIETGRLKIMDLKLGDILGSTPLKDNLPELFVSRFLTDIDTDEILGGYRSSFKGKTGAYFTPMDGGATEYAKAQKYKVMADRLRFDFPKVAGVFDRLCESYLSSGDSWKSRKKERALER
jgi:hypothetical protein